MSEPTTEQAASQVDSPSKRVSSSDLLDRDFLASLEAAVKNEAEQVVNPAWKRMWFRLADAIDCADAFVARSTEQPKSQ